MWTTVHREISPWDAHIVAGRLRAEGLQPVLQSVEHVSVFWAMSLALGMVHVQVPTAEAAQARQVLQAWQQGDYDDALAAELSLPAVSHCPQCGSYRWRALRSVASRALAVVCTLYFGGAAFSPEVVGRRCRRCGLRQSLAEMNEGNAA